MRTFDAAVRPGALWLVGVGPPLLLIALVQGWANGWRAGDLRLGEVMALVAFTQAAPVAALAWMLCSVAAYSLAPGRLVVHRAIMDREYALDAVSIRPRPEAGAVVLVVGARKLRLRPVEPEAFIGALAAVLPGGGPITPVSRPG